MDTDAIYNKNVDLVPHELPIIVWPDKRLHNKCKDITGFDDENDKFLTQLFLDMSLTMIKNQGFGIAAPQVAIMANFIVILYQFPGTDKPKPLALINPKIISSSEDMFAWEEGCLSVPGYYENRERPNTVIVNYKDVEGNEREAEFRGIYAFVVQHEIDHLNGELFIDNLSMLKKKFTVKKRIKNFLKQK